MMTQNKAAGWLRRLSKKTWTECLGASIVTYFYGRGLINSRRGKTC